MTEGFVENYRKNAQQAAAEKQQQQRALAAKLHGFISSQHYTTLREYKHDHEPVGILTSVIDSFAIADKEQASPMLEATIWRNLKTLKQANIEDAKLKAALDALEEIIPISPKAASLAAR